MAVTLKPPSYGTANYDPPPRYTPHGYEYRKIPGDNRYKLPVTAKQLVMAFFLIFALIFGGITVVTLTICKNPSPSYERHVAIIGAGPAGISAAYHINKFAKSAGIPHKISLYDKEPHIGGSSMHRITISDSGESVDLGAASFPRSAKALVDAANELKVPMDVADSEIGNLVGSGGGRFAVYDGGNGWVYLEPRPTNFLARGWWNVKLWFFYGSSPGNSQKLVSATRSAFNRLYSPSFLPFRSILAALRSVGLEPEVSSTAESFLNSKQISEKFQREIFNPWVRASASQNLGTLNALSAFISAAGVSKLTVSGGLQTGLWDRMVQYSKAETHLRTHVFGARRGDWGGWMLGTSSSTGEEEYIPFDAVVLATPWGLANLKIQENPLKQVPRNTTYTGLHMTLFTSPHWIAMKDSPAVILTTVPEQEYRTVTQQFGVAGQGNVGFWSLNVVKEIVTQKRGKEYVYKFMTSTQLDDDIIASWVGGEVTWIHREYLPTMQPILFPGGDLDWDEEDAEICVEDGFWYTGGMERFVAGIEMAALAGMNAAKLVVQKWAAEGLHLPEERMIPDWMRNGSLAEFYQTGYIPESKGDLEQ